MSRSYWALAQCSRALVRATSEDELLQQLCRVLVQVGEYAMAWVGYAVHDPARSVRRVAQAGFSEGYVESIPLTWADDVHGRGPGGAAIRTGKPLVVRNTDTDPAFEPWREAATERGFASVIGLPINLASGTVGSLTVYSSRVDAFDAEEEELLQRLTADVAYGIDSLRARAERRRAEEAVAESEELFRTAFENSLVGKALTSADGRYVRVNGALCRMLGRTADEMLELRYADVTHPEDREASDEAVRRTLVGETSAVELEKRYVRKDGSLLLAQISVSLVRAPDGAPRYFITDVQDVTTRRRAEEQLRQSQRMQALTMLAGGIAHDFSNLLSVMLSSSRFALAAAPQEGQLHDDIEEFHAAAQKARTVTRQLLAFGRRHVLDPRPIELGGLVRDGQRTLEQVVGERIRVRTTLSSDPCTILADSGQIERMLVDLAANARDAMPRGGTLTISTALVDGPPGRAPDVGLPPPGGGVLLVVSDTGAGMDEQTRSRIFEPFFTTKPVGKGTGLGLSSAASIVTAAGGCIHVDTGPLQGTRFEIRFPRLEHVAEPEIGPEAPGAAAEPTGHVVLVVDDDDQLRRIAARTLRDAGFTVLAAGTLDEAVERVANHPQPPSVLLADVRLLGTSGPELSAELTIRMPGLRTVYMSGYASEDLADEVTFPAGTAFLQKPFTAEALVARIRESLPAG